MNERGNDPSDRVPAELAGLDAELPDAREVQRTLERRVDPGPTALGVSVGVVLLLVALVLPWTGPVQGWTVLAGSEWIGPLPRLFVSIAIGVGVLGSALALVLRWWALAWLCAVGSGIGVVTGVWAIWSRQTVVPDGGTGPGIGLVVAEVAVIVLTVCWVRIALRR
ncbi:TMEM198/TM7SF3 family protein [Pseudonocardia humida]|uniref:Uncharacterized protein n=1 Tax=Pseudonocardia humida TaxID=2800819 RepID=A0ABT1ACQ2_9PSEU|nr:TMEM198/TM7SF3 family protein [Pseudonocardia humida]MCO1660841.1 hypothetical protein [Pseudonocardia humida]